MQHIELLAPAGSFEALKAAVQNGADAVYLGGVDFGARAYASNFDSKTMIEAVEYAHVRGVKIYITVNTLMKDSEIEKLIEYIKFLYEIDVDAVIVQDMGVFNLIKEIFPDFEIHASTQMTLHNKYGVKLLKDMGVNRVVLARELKIEEIKNIYDETHMELEVFVHGALCVCYSGQCLMSSFIGGRSGNRGRCAQPCRKEYRLLNLTKSSLSDANKGFHLSMRDLNTFQEVGKLIDAGVTSFKIEGRMKKPQYVASIVRNYRNAIDTYLNNKKFLNSEVFQEEMEQIFNRKFTKGYLFNSPKSEVINIEKPNNRGLYLGKVEDYDRKDNRIKIKLEVDIAQGDGIEIWNKSSGDIGGTVRNIYINNKLVKEALKGQTVQIELRGSIKKGDEVYKTLNIKLMDELEKTYLNNKEKKKILLYGEVKVEIGHTIKLYLWDQDGHTTYFESKEIVERAKNVSLTEEKLVDQLSKLGNTPFELANLKVSLEESSSIPVSVINSLRRDGVNKLIELRKVRNSRQQLSTSIIQKKLKDIYLSDDNQYNKTKNAKLSVKVDTLKRLKAVLNHPVERIYYGDIITLKEAIQLCKEKDIPIYLRTPSILRDKEYEILENLVEVKCINGILAGDLGIVAFNKNHWELPLIADTSLNIMNSYTINYFEKLGFKGVTLSSELDIKNIRRLQLDNTLEKEVIIYGSIAVMTTEYCPLIQENQCNHKCEKCMYPKYEYNFGLKDPKNITFPFCKDYWGRSIVLNSQPLFMLDKLKDFNDINISWFRLEFTNEDEEEIDEIMEVASSSININMKDKKEQYDILSRFKEGFTRGHYYRGVE